MYKIIYYNLNKANVIPTSISNLNNKLSPFRPPDLCVHDVLKIVLKLLLLRQYINLPVNFYLKKINVKTNDQCYFCKNGVETHVFVCVKKINVFKGISAWIYIEQPNKDLVLMLVIIPLEKYH